MCWAIDPALSMGFCTAFCAGPPEAPTCAGGGLCSVFGGGFLRLCLPRCDPLDAAATCPAAARQCAPRPDALGFQCIWTSAEGPGAYKKGCDMHNDCHPGYYCAPPAIVPGCAGSGCCTPYCDLGAPDTCSDLDPALACMPLYPPGEAPEGLEELGLCRL
jgi:hypothetical protein